MFPQNDCILNSKNPIVLLKQGLFRGVISSIYFQPLSLICWTHKSGVILFFLTFLLPSLHFKFVQEHLSLLLISCNQHIHWWLLMPYTPDHTHSDIAMYYPVFHTFNGWSPCCTHQTAFSITLQHAVHISLYED